MHTSIYAVYDIETVPNDRAKAYYASKTYDPPSNYKDPVKIDAAIREKRHADMERAALHWWTGRVVCICASVIGADTPNRWFSGKDELQVLTKFFDWLWWVEETYERPTLTGKSTDYFDTPFLVGRALAHDLGIPATMTPRYPITDVDRIFSASSHCDQRSSLANYAWGLEIAGKTSHGSDVASLWLGVLEGDPTASQKLVDYCANDTAIAREMLRRWLKPYIPLSEQLTASNPIDPIFPDDPPF